MQVRIAQTEVRTTMPESPLRDAVRAQLRALLSSTGEVEEYLQSAVESVQELIELEASYTLSTSLYGDPFTVATTDRKAWDTDQVEFDLADGPCFEVLMNDAEFGGIDLRTERRWPAWAAVAELHGFGSAAAVGAPLESGQKIVLNGYGVGETLLEHDAVDRAREFIEELAFTMPIALRLARQMTEVSQLQQALASRSTIDQALGVLMAQNRCTRDEAFAILRRASQTRNVKLRDVAAALIERFTGHPAEPPPPFRPPTRP
jgi:ANTAR domain